MTLKRSHIHGRLFSNECRVGQIALFKFKRTFKQIRVLSKISCEIWPIKDSVRARSGAVFSLRIAVGVVDKIASRAPRRFCLPTSADRFLPFNYNFALHFCDVISILLYRQTTTLCMHCLIDIARYFFKLLMFRRRWFKGSIYLYPDIKIYLPKI